MTRKLFLSVATIMLFLSLLLFSACNLKELGRPLSQEGKKEVTIIIGDEVFNVQTSEEYVHGLLGEMAAEKGFDYESAELGYGVSVMKIKDIVTSYDWTSWVNVFHDINDVTLIDNYGTFSYCGKEYFLSLVSVDMLPVLDGHTYLFEQGNIS